MPKQEEAVHHITSITSNGDRLDPASHQVDLAVVASQVISIGDVGQGLTSQQKYIILKRLNYEGLTTLEDLPVNASVMIEKIENLSDSEAVEILKECVEDHAGDPNFPTEVFELIEKLLEMDSPFHSTGDNVSNFGKAKEHQIHEEKLPDASSLEADDVNFDTVFDWSLQVRMEAALIAFWSPYPEVRSVTDCYDDPSMHCETPRVYIVGIIWMAVGSFINQFFYERQPTISLSSSVVQLLLLPSGTFLAAVLPKWKFKIWKYTIDLNPGPWNHKEQLLATIIYSVSASPSYVSFNILVQRLELFYDNKWADWGYQVLLALSNNFLGFGLAGIMRKFAVYPVRAMWPTLLPTLALNSALVKPEKKENINGWTISRFKYFCVVFSVSFLYFWLPDYLMQFLSIFNWMTWISPTNRTLAEITGSVGGLGFNPIPTFDWNVIKNASPLYLPFYTAVANYTGALIGFLTICGVYYTNNSWSGYIPINSNRLFTNTGAEYSVSDVVNERSLFDQEKYDKIGPPYYSAANLVIYGAFHALYPFAIIYESFFNHKAMWGAIKGLYKTARHFSSSTFESFKDPHTQMMRQYKEVPEWAFTIVLVISIVLAIICVKVYPAETPVWGIFFALGMNFVFLFPILAIYSTTGFAFGLNVLVELIVGYAIPGNGLAMNFIKAFGYNIDGQAENYITDQKMAH